MENGDDSVPIFYKHVRGEHNPSDVGTKLEITPFSKVISDWYQRGSFIELPEECWEEYCGNFKEVSAQHLPGLQRKYQKLLTQDPYLLDRHARDEERLDKGQEEEVVEDEENEQLPKTSSKLLAWADAVKKFKDFGGKYRAP